MTELVPLTLTALASSESRQETFVSHDPAYRRLRLWQSSGTKSQVTNLTQGVAGAGRRC